MRRAGAHNVTNSTENLIRSEDFHKSLSVSSHVNVGNKVGDSTKVVEKFNRELMDLYLDFQKKSQANLLRFTLKIEKYFSG